MDGLLNPKISKNPFKTEDLALEDLIAEGTRARVICRKMEDGILESDWDDEPLDSELPIDSHEFSDDENEDDDDWSFNMSGGFPPREPWAPKVIVERAQYENADCSNVFLEGKKEQFDWSGTFEPTVVTERVLVARVTRDRLCLFPMHARPGRDTFLTPRYTNLRSVTILPGRYWALPKDDDQFDQLLQKLPTGFSRRAHYGLGLKWEYRQILEAIDDIKDVSEVVLHRGDGFELQPPAYRLGVEHFTKLRQAMDTINRKARAGAFEDRELVVYKALLRDAAPDRFKERIKTLKAGYLYELAKVGNGSRLKSAKDRTAAVSIVKSEAEELAKSDPEQLLSLKAAIEAVTLDELIARFEGMLSKKLTEGKWQAFFQANPFILSLAFAYPVFMVSDQAHVGGQTLAGVGEKIADFLFAQHYSGNVALIEIKRPDTPLLQQTTFRTNLYAPHKELTGAISQVLDQRYQLESQFAYKLMAARRVDLAAYSIHCVVIAGMTPQTGEEHKSLDLYRNSSKHVLVVTFNELLEKLRIIQRLMKGEGASE